MSRANRDFFVGLMRALAGALIFALPMLLTMEMWWIGAYADPWRLVILTIIQIPLLIWLARFSSFRPATKLLDYIVDAFVALAVAFVMASAILLVLGRLEVGMPWNQTLGVVVIQAFPGSFGAVLARVQTGEQKDGDGPQRGYGDEVVLMAAGAIFLGLNVAPTQEIILLSNSMTGWRLVALAVLSIVLMHAFVFSLDFSGEPDVAEGAAFVSLFMRFTMVGYAVVLAISFYLLWTFGRLDGMGIEAALAACTVLAFPCAIGAAGARIIL